MRSTAMTLVSNPSDKQVCLVWGATPYFIPAKHAVALPTRVAEDCLPHEDYDFLIKHDIPEGVSPDNAANDVTAAYAAGEPIPAALAPDRNTDPPKDLNPEWDPMTCAYEEIDTYIEKVGLNVDPDLDEAAVRQLVDEHSQ